MLSVFVAQKCGVNRDRKYSPKVSRTNASPRLGEFSVSKERIGTTFHETFALNLAAVAAVLRVCDDYDGDVSPDLIKSETNLGPNYVKSMPMYARGAGLLEIGAYRLTSFGRLVRDNDPNLTKPETLWLMHYYISSPSGPGPAFWNHLITNFLRIGQPLRRTDISDAISQFLDSSGQKRLTTRTLESTATAFLGSYAKSDGFGKLGLLQPKEESQGIYEVRQPNAAPLWSVGCALAEYWDAVGGGASELLLKDLGRQEGFAGIFCMGSGMLGAMLSELQTAGVVTIKRDAPPFVVTRLWRDATEIRKHLYV